MEFIDDRDRDRSEETVPVRMYRHDKEELERLLEGRDMTMPERLRRAVKDLDAKEKRHPYVRPLHRLQEKLRREGFIEEADQLQLLAGLWGRMESCPELRGAMSREAMDGLRDAIQLDPEETETEVETGPTIRPNPEADDGTDND